MAEYINIAPREHVEKRITMEAKPGDAYSESTGRKETTKYTGTWADMLAQATELIGGGGGSVQVTCELDRLEGGIGELTVTLEHYRVGGGGADVPDEPDGGSGDELGSEADPCFSSSSQLVEVHLLSHPKFAGLTDLERRALKAMIDGQDEESLIALPDRPDAKVKIKDCISSDAGRKAFELVGRGVTGYLELAMEVTARWKGRSQRFTPGEIVSSPPGGFNVPSGRDFLVSGAGCEKNGKDAWSSASFRMSGPEGWDRFLYGS